MLNVEEQKNLAYTLCMGYKFFFGDYHQNNVREDEYLDNFKYYYEVVKQSSGRVGQHPIIIDQKLRDASLDPETASAAQTNTTRNKSEEEILAMALIHKANKEKYGSLLCHLDNKYNLGNDNYPTSVTVT